MRVLAATAVALILFPPAARGAPPENRWDHGFLGGFVAVDRDLGGPGHVTLEPTLGFRARYGLTERWGLLGDALYADFTTDTFRGDARMITARGGLSLLLTAGKQTRWFLDGAAGYMDIAFDGAPDFYSAFASGGIGQDVQLGGRKWLRWELRLDQSLAEAGLDGDAITQPQFLIGFGWGARGEVRDSDGDGVPDSRDRCASTPAGRSVDEAGCPLPAPAPAPEPPPPADRDGDGVPDDADRCERTLQGIEVDEHGCPLDADGDGVYDGLGMDKCPGTPPGAVVDVHGCPRDGDGDGVFDGLDRCPETPPGARVGTDGCPAP